MFAYVCLGSNNLNKAGEFYDELLAGLGATRSMQQDNFVSWAITPNSPNLAIYIPFDGKEATAGNGTMFALMAESPEQVDALHAKALELGATDEGAAGPRAGGLFYAGYFRDLDGNKLNIFHMS